MENKNFEYCDSQVNNFEVASKVAKESKVLNNMINTKLNKLFVFAEFQCNYLGCTEAYKRTLLADQYLSIYVDNYKELKDIDENELKELVELVDGIIEDVIYEL